MANEKNLKPFEKGDSRINRKGRPATKHITDWLKHPERQEDLDKMMNKTMKLAIGGNMRAVEFITDRLEGKAKTYMDWTIENNPDKDKPIKVFDIEGLNYDNEDEDES